MEERNELNDIILKKNNSTAGSKKLLLVIATLTIALIVILVAMNSLKDPAASKKNTDVAIPNTPTAPTEVINDPLFEPVEVIQEESGGMQNSATENLDHVAQKIKDEAAAAPEPVQSVAGVPTIATKPSAPAQPVMTQTAPVAKPVTPVAKPTAPETSKALKAAAVEPKKAAPKPVEPKVAPKAVTQAPSAPKTAPVAIKESPKPAVTKPVPLKPTQTKPAPIKEAPVAKAVAPASGDKYYIQVGVFSAAPSPELIERLNASGMKYTLQKSGTATKVLVGPFQGEQATKDALQSLRQNVEAKAFKVKG